MPEQTEESACHEQALGTSIPITSDASETVIGFKDDPTADASVDDFWGSFDTLTGKINIHVIGGTIFTGTCKPEP